MKLLRPALVRVQHAEKFHHERRKPLGVLRRSGLALERRRENRRGLFLRAIQRRHLIQAMVGKPAAVGMEEIMALLQRLQKTFERGRVGSRGVAQSFHPFLETFRLIDAQRVVGAERRKHFHLPAGFYDGFVMFEPVGGIVRGANHFDVHALDKSAHGIARLREQAARFVPDFLRRAFFQQFFNAKIALQFQMRPMEQRIAQGFRNGGGPRLEFFARRRFVAGDQLFRHAVGPHRAPFVMVAAQPRFVDILKAPVFRQVLWRKMAVIINDGLVRRGAVIQLAGHLVRQQKIFVAEFHIKWSWHRTRRPRRVRFR